MNLNTNSSTKKTSSTTGSATTDSPYLGSKISLVSKAKIRYEGILYTIDANESTVALSKVRSFGTEDRPTDRPVPAREEIFEYIIFRGADIEDLQVREPPQTSLTQDPAIVESSAYPDNARSTSIGTNTSLTGLAGQGSNRSLSNRGTMPSPPSHQGQGTKGYKSSDPLRQFNLNQQRSNRSYNHQSPMMPYEGNARRYRPSQHQDYYPLNRRSSAYQAEWTRPGAQRYPRGLPTYDNNRFYPSRRNGGFQGQGQRQRRNSTGGMNTSSTRNAHRQQQHQQQQQQQQGERTRSNGTTSRSTLKFVGDFDFEKSNAEFDKNAIEDELKKSLSLKTTKKTDGETSNDEQEKEKEKENQNEQEKHQQQQEQLDHHQQTHLDTFYDKQKSFFDCISCEANEKEKTSNRRNWNEERRVNAETFGLKYRPFQQNNGGNSRPGNRRNNNGGGAGGQRYQRTNYSGRNAGYYGNFSNRVRVY